MDGWMGRSVKREVSQRSQRKKRFTSINFISFQFWSTASQAEKQRNVPMERIITHTRHMGQFRAVIRKEKQSVLV